MVRYANYGNMVDEPSGAWVLFTDAQAKSLADERRIAELEKALADALHRLEWFRDQKGMDSAAQIDWARAALRVETKAIAPAERCPYTKESDK